MRIFVTVLVLVLMPSALNAVPSNRQLPYMANETWWCSQDWFVCPGTHCKERAWDFNWGGGSADLGMPLLAPADGIIEYAGNTGTGYGIVVLIRYSDGSFDRITHCQSVVVQKGEVVKQGQVLAFCGSSGSDAVHIHVNAQSSSSPSASGIYSLESKFYYRQGSIKYYGRPIGCKCSSNPPSWAYYTSLNSGVFDREFNANGGSTTFGNKDGEIHWWHGWSQDRTRDPLYDSYNTARRCYIQDYFGKIYSDCAIVCDALGGARKAITVRNGFWTVWAQEKGPQGRLGMPLANEYNQGGSTARQDFQKGYLYYNGSSVSVNYYPKCAPGWTSSGWNNRYSYLFALAFERNNARNKVGEALVSVYSWNGYYRQNFQGGTYGKGAVIYDPKNFEGNSAATNEVYYIYGQFLKFYETDSRVGPSKMGAPTRDKSSVTQYFKYGRFVEKTRTDGKKEIWAYDAKGNYICKSAAYFSFIVNAPSRELELVPTSVVLGQNFPNPFNPLTNISFSLPEATRVSLRVYDVKGRLIKVLVDEERRQGEYTVAWNGTDEQGEKLASGVYFYCLETSTFTQTKKMVLLR